MHSTKTEILAHLKRSDGSTVDELSTTLGLAAMTVRQHLTALERDALVSAEEVRRRTGRPHYRYRLTDGGHRRMSEGHDRMVALLVDAAGRLNGATADPEERRRSLFRRAAEDLAARHQHELLQLEGAARADRLIEVLRAYGGFPEWHAVGDAVEVRDFACVFRETVGAAGACDWHEPFLRAAAGAEVEADRATDESCAACCRYLIKLPATAAKGPR